MSQTQVSPDMITHLCQEIRNMKTSNQNAIVNNKVLPVIPNNIPDQSDNYGRDGHDDEGTSYSTRYPSPPSDNPGSLTRRDSSPLPTRPVSPRTLPGPSRSHVPVDAAGRIYALGSAASDEDPSLAPSDPNSRMGTSSPCANDPRPSSAPR